MARRCPRKLVRRSRRSRRQSRRSDATATPPQREPPTSSTLCTGAFTLCGGSDAYGRHVSGAMESRAAVFTSQPQAVEVYQAGAWWSGELLGWRHEADGTCQVSVRVTLGGIEETAWMDLTGLRLPERHLAVAPEPAVAGDASSTQKLPRASSAARRGRPAPGHSAATASMPAVRDLSVVPAGPRSGGRRRAPEAPEAVTAPASPPLGRQASRPGGPRDGRRRSCLRAAVRRSAPGTRGGRAGGTARGRRRDGGSGRRSAPRGDGRRPRTAPEGRHGAVPRDQGLHPGDAFRRPLRDAARRHLRRPPP